MSPPAPVAYFRKPFDVEALGDGYDVTDRRSHCVRVRWWVASGDS
jgi:hypothetical protein